MTYACPCCGYKTLTEKPTGTYEICPVCFWEDDPVQYRDPFDKNGANKVSLMEAKKNFSDFGAVERKFISKVRKPLPEELSKGEGTNCLKK
jgi:hypothetical protein